MTAAIANRSADGWTVAQLVTAAAAGAPSEVTSPSGFVLRRLRDESPPDPMPAPRSLVASCHPRHGWADTTAAAS